MQFFEYRDGYWQMTEEVAIAYWTTMCVAFTTLILLAFYAENWLVFWVTMGMFIFCVFNYYMALKPFLKKI